MDGIDPCLIFNDIAYSTKIFVLCGQNYFLHCVEWLCAVEGDHDKNCPVDQKKDAKEGIYAGDDSEDAENIEQAADHFQMGLFMQVAVGSAAVGADIIIISFVLLRI